MIFPWVRQAQDLLQNDDLIGFEKLQFSVVWSILDRLGAARHFDFEALIIYRPAGVWSAAGRAYKGEAAVVASSWAR